MQQIHWFILALLSILSCQPTATVKKDKLAEKAEPNEMFSFQRSYPDRDFDWKGWRKAIVAARNEAISVQERSVSGCSGNASDWTQQGPGNIGGRVNTLAVKPDDENIVLAGFSAGGIFKTTDGGINWYPVFDDHIELSIGDIVFDPTNPNIVYAGTGDPNMPSIVFNGDGIFKSTDAGESWQYAGLSQQGIVSKIQIDPLNPQNIYAATMGNPYVRDSERGIYKSSDGGATWQQVLFVSNQAGASDLVINPSNPQVLYASFWDRIRSNTESIIYGPHARIYKTTDGGATWTQLGGGLPTGIMGRTGLAMSAQNPDKLYAVFIDSLSTPGGLYKTTDGGTTWSSVDINALEDKCGDFGWYFGKIALNPSNDEEIYFHAIIMWRKAAGTNTWLTASGGHADSHDLVILPSGKRYWANDGGVYRKEANSNIWTRCKNLPTTQFYHTTYNPHTPDIYWAGAQDNGIKKGNAAGFNDWANVYPADGFRCGFHPTDPNTYWVEIQNGAIMKTTDGGATWLIGQSCLGTSDRCNWDTPYFISAHNPDIQYAATYRVYNSSSGTAWSPISTDLTDGIIYGPRFHTVSCLNESLVLAAKLLAGTSDGNVWRREPTGGWVNITGNLPDRYVTSVHGSTTLPHRLFVTHSGFRNNEYIPHVHRSDDNGQTWLDISGNLPQIPVNDLLIMPGHADSILFAATDAGVYFTRNRGTTWGRLGGNMPFIPVFDLEHNPVRKELMAATYARGLWTFPLDSVFAQQNAVTVNVSGGIKTESGTGVGNVTVSGQTSGSDGAYLIPGIPGCQTITLAPYRNDNPLNGVSTYDLVLISKHILGIETLGSPYKMIAADANKSNSITTFDIVAIRKVILGIDTAFAGNTSWRFIPVDFLFPNPVNPFETFFPESRDVSLQDTPLSGLDFTAVKVGDVNGSANPVKEISAEERNIKNWPIFMQDVDFESGEKATATFQAGLTDLAGAQFSLQFDPEQLKFERIEPLLPGLSADNFGINRTASGVLTVCFENPAAFKPAIEASSTRPLFRIIFKAKSSGSLQTCVQVTEIPTPAFAFRSNGTLLKPVLHTSSGMSATVQVWPNPFGQSGVRLRMVESDGTPWSEPVHSTFTIQIFDNRGKLIHQKNTAEAGTAFLPADIFPIPGTYFYKISGEKIRVGKLVFVP
ncbi:MAG: Ycf48-like protein [Saprospiraceae bacterium]|nr:Ycf48-like protein [Saprospiraceae bacterium]